MSISINKKISFLLAFVLLLWIVLPITHSFASNYPYETISKSNVNLRKSDSATATIVARIVKGEMVTIQQSKGEYYQVTINGNTGYALKMYIDGTDSTADPEFIATELYELPPSINKYPYTTTTLGEVKFRKKPEATAEVIKLLEKEQLVTVLDLTDNGFAKIKIEDTTGYVVASYLILANIPAPTPVPTPTPHPSTLLYTEVKKGSTGVFVKSLQEALIDLGYLEGESDGKFGAKTEQALLLFEKRNGLPQDGIADTILQNYIYDEKPKDVNGYRQKLKLLPPIPGAIITLDSKGEPVINLQNRLVELGYYTAEVTGIYDKATKLAYSQFESKHHMLGDPIRLDDIVTPDESALLFSAVALPFSTIVTPTPRPTIEPPLFTVREGDEGIDATRVQQRLHEMGYYTGKITGKMDTKTTRALKKFQEKSGLEADGVCGDKTRTMLFATDAIYLVPTPMPVPTPSGTPPITKETVILIEAGSRGDYVRTLQMRLQELSYYTSRQDGVYLSDDITAVRDFQKNNGLIVDGKAGYETQSVLFSDEAIMGNAIVMPKMMTTLRFGSNGENVTLLQERLITLGYLEDIADGKFGVATKNAVIDFQKMNNLVANGVVVADTYKVLFSENALDNLTPENVVLKLGSNGENVVALQSRLNELGYFTYEIDGDFGLKTLEALIKFQQNNNLTANGVADYATISLLNSSSATTAFDNPIINFNLNYTDNLLNPFNTFSNKVQYANWYSEIIHKARELPNVTVYDFTTGISWGIHLFSFGAHADGEPITPQDTENMNHAFGGETTWTPKPVWVIFSDGSIYMGSTHNVAHDPYHNHENNFNGHLCIHFPRTQSQVAAIGPYATSHQIAIDAGWQATVKQQ